MGNYNILFDLFGLFDCGGGGGERCWCVLRLQQHSRKQTTKSSITMGQHKKSAMFAICAAGSIRLYVWAVFAVLAICKLPMI